MPDAYVALKWIHILGAAILFGTGLGTAFHLWMAHRSGDVRAIAIAARSTVIADYAFTLPAVIVQPLTGFALALMAGYPLGSGWLVASIVLYLFTGACWIPVVVLQVRMKALAEKSAREGTPLDAEYGRLAARWLALGWPAFAAVIAIFWLMVAKPAWDA